MKQLSGTERLVVMPLYGSGLRLEECLDLRVKDLDFDRHQRHPICELVMDLMAMRGGILDWRRATAIVSGVDRTDEMHARRSATATRVAAFLSRHPRVSEVFHPSLASHPDAKAIARDYVRHGSLLSFRIAGADKERTRHFSDVLATCVIVRYALSFDGLATKVNHHRTVSEYFTPIDRSAAAEWLRSADSPGGWDRGR